MQVHVRLLGSIASEVFNPLMVDVSLVADSTRHRLHTLPAEQVRRCRPADSGEDPRVCMTCAHVDIGGPPLVPPSGDPAAGAAATSPLLARSVNPRQARQLLSTTRTQRREREVLYGAGGWSRVKLSR
ncbi:hypothetical protein ON010_g5428 [Phytophthora cinnamomi]|nr:hypothetical protein ON010_g5428 [Phytophthora cinnamomi]